MEELGLFTFKKSRLDGRIYQCVYISDGRVKMLEPGSDMPGAVGMKPARV